MRRFLIGWLVAAGAIAFGQEAPEAPTLLQGGGVLNHRPTPNGPAPRARDGKPDLSGIWNPDRHFIYDISTALKPGETLPLQPWAAEATKKRISKDDP